MALPANVGKGTVEGIILDGDGNPVTGKFVFTPSVANLKDATALPPVTIVPGKEEVTLDGTGAFTIDLLATDDPDLNPTGWTWEVSFSGSVQIATFHMSVPEGSTQDITLVAPVAKSGGTAVIVGPGVPDGGLTGQVLAKASAADQDTEWVDQTGGTGSVDSVNGQTGVVVLDAADVGAAGVGHNHDADYAALGHVHDDRYYTESEMDTALAGKSDTTHNHDATYAALVHSHDDLYYTEAEVDLALQGKADDSHVHAPGDISGGTFSLDLMPPGYTHTVDKAKNGDVWPGSRPSARTDITVIWKGDTDPGALAIEGDEWKVTP